LWEGTQKQQKAPNAQKGYVPTAQKKKKTKKGKERVKLAENSADPTAVQNPKQKRDGTAG